MIVVDVEVGEVVVVRRNDSSAPYFWYPLGSSGTYIQYFMKDAISGIYFLYLLRYKTGIPAIFSMVIRILRPGLVCLKQ